MNKKSKEIIRLIMILIGNILDSAGFVLFVSGSGLITGGTSGIGLFLSRQTGIPTSVYVFIINAIMLLVGLIILGKRFAISTILSTFCYPLSMAVMEHVLHGQSLTNDIFLCTIMGGILIGTGVGLVIRAGASSGVYHFLPAYIWSILSSWLYRLYRHRATMCSTVLYS